MDGTLLSTLWVKSLHEWVSGKIPLLGVGGPLGKGAWIVFFWLLAFFGIFFGFSTIFIEIWDDGRTTAALLMGALFNGMVVSTGLAGIFLLVRALWRKFRK